MLAAGIKISRLSSLLPSFFSTLLCQLDNQMMISTPVVSSSTQSFYFLASHPVLGSRGVMTDWSNKNVSTSNQNDALPGVIQERKNSSGYKSGVAACREHLSSGSLELSVQCWPINHDQGYRQTWGSKMLTFPVRRIKSYSAIRISFA